MQAVIVAGGKGTRLAQSTNGLPKPMVQIGGKPLLEHQVLLCRKHAITDILLLTGFGSEQIENYFGDGSRWGTQIRYHHEPAPLGTAGAVLNAFDLLQERFLVLYGDTMVNVDLARFAAANEPNSAVQLFVHPNDHPCDSDLVELDSGKRIAAFRKPPHPNGACFANLVNAALYVMSKETLRDWRSTYLSQELNFGKTMFPAMLAQGVRLFAYRSREYIKDAGTPARLDEVRQDYASGRVQTRSLDTALPAVFLDRDGTLNADKKWIRRPEQIELLPGSASALRAINRSGWLAVLITNQPVIARGEATEPEVERIHHRLEWLLGQSGGFLDAIYYCPHHPGSGFTGERRELKIACSCRKPAAGLFELAASELNIDRSRSWMIGDSPVDVQAARNFGVASALLTSTNDTGSCKPDKAFPAMPDAVSYILNNETASCS
jgi:D,D-heptose 1,7-bisphosphate phosphatase